MPYDAVNSQEPRSLTMKGNFRTGATSFGWRVAEALRAGPLYAQARPAYVHKKGSRITAATAPSAGQCLFEGWRGSLAGTQLQRKIVSCLELAAEGCGLGGRSWGDLC